MTRPIPSASPSIEAETAYAHITRSSTKWATGPSYASIRKQHCGLPEWPRGLARRVHGLRMAVTCPNHSGLFREFAFPSWWRDGHALIRRQEWHLMVFAGTYAIAALMLVMS